jgi:hypothetical protein
MQAGHIKPITDGAIAGTGSIDLDGNIFGGFILNADGTNSASIEIRINDSAGEVLVDANSTISEAVFAPFRATSGRIYYSISGTGASASLYEWIE